MHQAITSAQIAHWFTVGVQFANITITDEVKKEAEAPATADSSVEQLSEQTSPEKAGSDGGNQKSRRPELPTSPGTTPPSLGSYEYPILPITKNRQELVSLIENNSVIIIRGATGSGKTTQLPQFILDHYAEKKTPCNLVVTQPRKIGATSIARWVARERKCTLGSMVGYQVGLEKMATEHTKLIYVTTGVLLQKLVSSKTLTEYSHIFIDEVHERTEELDFLLLVVRKLLRTNSRYVKVILMSATINCAEFAEYFGTPIRNQMNPAYVFEVEGAPYAIEEFYLDELKTILPLGINVDLTFPVDPCITEEMYNVAVSLIQSFDEMEQTGSATHPERGSVLVFLPGLAEIQYMKEALAKLVRKRLQVYPLHSTVTLEEQNGVFLVPVPGYRKIILSTNIAESSVTVPDVKYVIDFCLVRQLVCDKETNYRCLRITWASKTSCNQRRGRAGRVSKGFCYRLVSRHFWEHEIPDFTIPEMLRSPLASTLLKVKLLDMGDPRSVLSTALTPPNLNDIERTVLQLKQIGALSVQSNSQRQFDGELTFLGRVLAHLPVDLQLGKLIVFGHVFGCLEECLIIGIHFIDEQLASKELSGNDPKTTIMVPVNLPPFAFLCYKQLQSLFRQCGQVKSIFLTQHIKIQIFFSWNIKFILQFSLSFFSALNIRDLRPVSVSLYPNLLCVAPFKDGQQMAKYYRAKVLHILGSNVEVFYVDFGNTSVVPCSSLRELPSDLMTPPFQVRFHTSCTPGKDGGKDGINSVMVNESPQNWHERMLVAATVSLSASGSRILLKETSLMPHIHGLPSIITMLFTPVMELRTNEDRTCFTGALCGLGWNSVSQNAVLPEHDIELAFDVKFEIEDITEINALRGTVNKLVCDGPNGLTNLSPEKISSLQEEARERLVGLFIKNPPRPECTPVYYEKFKKWNQLQEKDDGKSKGVLFQLHPITLLNM
uniref:ATP-dependent RNA helicase TDRD9 n=1 Tax=Cyprinus carpio TaxID=7962 RepID=A0A8C1ISF0_CYPCA